MKPFNIIFAALLTSIRYAGAQDSGVVERLVPDFCVHRAHLNPELACPTDLKCKGVEDIVTAVTYVNYETVTSIDYQTVNHTLVITETDLKVSVVTMAGSNIGFCESTTTTTDSAKTSTLTVWKPSTVTQHAYSYTTTTVTRSSVWESVRQSPCVRDVKTKPKQHLVPPSATPAPVVEPPVMEQPPSQQQQQPVVADADTEDPDFSEADE